MPTITVTNDPDEKVISVSLSGPQGPRGESIDTLAEVNDVQFTTLQNADILQYSTLLAKWENKTIDSSGIVSKSGDQTISGTKTLTDNLLMSSTYIRNVADPILDQDVATKKYVDNNAQGLKIKDSVYVASTGNIDTSAPPEDTNGVLIDSVTVPNGSRILLKDQTNAIQNGIYTLQTDTLVRAIDANEDNELDYGSYVYIQNGIANGGSSYVCQTQNVVIGVDENTWIKFSGAQQLSGGTGIEILSNVITVKSADIAKIDVSASGVNISSSYIGQTSISTVGTVTTGVWNATPVSLTYGGLGSNLSGLSNGAILKKSGSTFVQATEGTDYLSSSSVINGGTY